MAPKVAVLGKFQYACAMEEFWARGFEAIGCEVFRDRGIVGGVDLSFAVKVDWLDPAQMSGKKVLYWCDHTTRFPAFHELAPHYDIAYTVHDEHIPATPGYKGPTQELGMVAGRLVKTYPYLPCGWDPQDCRRYPSWKKHWDVVFIGTQRPERDWIPVVLDLLNDGGFKTGLWGNGWGNRGLGDIYGEARNRVVGATQININYHYPRDSFNMRFAELSAMGAFQMSDMAPGLEPLGFRAGVHYIPLPKDCEKMEHVIAHDISGWLSKWKAPARALVARRATEAARPHTYAARAKSVLKDSGLL